MAVPASAIRGPWGAGGLGCGRRGGTVQRTQHTCLDMTSVRRWSLWGIDVLGCDNCAIFFVRMRANVLVLLLLFRFLTTAGPAPAEANAPPPAPPSSV